MQIIKSRKIVDTPWQVESTVQGAEASSPESRILPLEQWLLWRDNRTCLKTDACPGVLLQPDDDLQRLAGQFRRLPVVALDVSRIEDGRVYTLASTLREQYQYKGELRAVGATLDNLAIMERCGFDAFDPRPGISVEDALQYFSEIEPIYGFWQQ